MQSPDRNGPTDQESLAERVRFVARAHAGDRGALLPVLHSLQERFGYIDAGCVPVLADELNWSRAEVHGVVTFYKDFRSSPPGRSQVRVCRAEACQAAGADELADHARVRIGVDFGGTTPDRAVSLDEVFCLGNCALGPSVMVNGTVHGRVDPERFDGLLAAAASAPEDLVDTGRGPSPAGVRVFLPRDTSARAVGADAVAAALSAEATVVRTGSRGMLWLEPLVEVETPGGRIGYGPVTPADVPGLLGAGALTGGEHPLRLGPVEALPWMAAQQRLIFRRVGVIDPLSVADHEATGGFAGLRAALAMDPAEITAAVTASGLRGRGGAGFPAGIKWETVRTAPGALKFVCANADEGDSGTFADRMLMEGDPFTLIEGIIIAALAVGSAEGYIYVRSEYPGAVAAMRAAIAIGYEQGWLGSSVLGSGRAFDLFVRVGAGAYICGEETSMLESLEGKRGEVRAKPPLPALEGLFGCPTVVNNVLTLASVPAILAGGADAYAALGTGRSLGTQVFQLAGDIARGGVFECAFGISLDELVNGYGGGTRSGRPVRAAQVGGPLGGYVPAGEFDLRLDYEAFAAAGAMVGHGGIVVFDDTVDMARQARFAMAFCAEESCGKCTPCRIGAVRGVELLDGILDARSVGGEVDSQLALLEDLCEVMADGSLCAMGGLTPMPVRSALRHFGDDFRRAGAMEGRTL